MLNYIWISLIALGILAAAGSDIADEAGNTYRNGLTLPATFEVIRQPSPLRASWEGIVVVPAADFNGFYGGGAADSTVRQPATLTRDSSGSAAGLNP